MLFAEDWWNGAGFPKPEPLADLWLNSIALEAEKIGWPRVERNRAKMHRSSPRERSFSPMMSIICQHMRIVVCHGFSGQC